jgi:hypothetical protein
MKKLLLLLVLGSAAWADGEVAKTFADKGSVYVRSTKPLKVGDELVMASDATGATEAGHAVVMEVNGALARIALDDDAEKAKAKFARLPVAAAVVAPVPAAAPRGNVLKGSIESNALRAVAHNDSNTPWTDCEFRFSDGAYNHIGTVKPMSDESSIFLKFTGPPEKPFIGVHVTCVEGEADFKFAEPSATHALAGFAERDGARVTVHNTGETTWTRCDVRKPDGSHYVMSALKGHDQDSIRGGAFDKDTAEKPRSLTLTCKEGELHEGPH